MLDLTLKIVADASQAKRELASVEQGINRVEQAAKKGEPSVAAVAKELGVYDNVTNKVIQSTAKLEQTTKSLAGATSDLVYEHTAMGKEMADMDRRLAALDERYKQTATSAKAFNESLIAGGIAIGGLVAAAALEFKFLADGARIYAERSGQMARFNDAIDSVTEHWRNMQGAVAGILIGNIHDIDQWANRANWIIDQMFSMIAPKLAQLQYMLSFLPGNSGRAPGPVSLPPSYVGNPFLSPGKDPLQFGPTAAAAKAMGLPADVRTPPPARVNGPGRVVAPYVVPTAGGGYNIGGIPGGSTFGLPTQLLPYNFAPSLSYGYGIHGSIGQQLPIPQAPGAAAPGFFGSVFGGNFGGNLSNVILQAVTGGGSFLQGAGSLIGSGIGGFAQKSLGLVSGIGGVLGSMLPGIGALLGPAIGGIGKLFGKLFGETQGHKDLMAANAQIGDLKSGLLRDFGSAENIKLLGGGDLNAGWGGQNIQGLQAFSKEVDTFRAKSVNAMNEMIHNAMTAGTAIPASMRPILESLIRQGQLTEANANLLMGLPEKGVPSFQQVSQAAAELGVNLDAIGKNIQNLKLTETAESAAQAFQTLKDAGADMGAVFAQAAPKIQDMVTNALQLGLTLPESIKPWIQQMVDAGLLLDETGQKLTDLSRFSFTKPLEKSVEDLIVKLDELIDTIKTGLGGALDELDGKQVDVTVNRHVVDDQSTTDPNVPGYARGTQGYEYFGSGRTVRLHGWEKVVPLSGGKSKEQVTVPVTIQMDNRVLAEVMARTYLAG